MVYLRYTIVKAFEVWLQWDRSYLVPQMLRLLYTTLIRPHLDYACIVWNPYQSSDIRVLEQVQRCVIIECVQHFSIFYIMIGLWH